MKIVWCMVLKIWSIADRIFSHFGPFYALLPPNNLENQNFEKMKKNNWRYHHFTKVYHKWQSYDVWFLRYEAWQTDFFVILGHFLPFYPTNNPKNQNFEKMKTTALYRSIPKIMTIYYTVPEIWFVTDVIAIFHFGLFFALLPP